ncbi:MAG TPA: SDR family NAD(P)-dependent oxidoreductase [Caulobacteraceae bacterium]|nr:SDR family NAD(P)-dependent oxidoreductase [Caulobacteraceae bacterium]
MKSFAGRIAVVTGGGSGMGRELVRQLAAEGASVAMCDVSRQSLGETKALCEQDGLQAGVRITCHVVDVSDEAQVSRFRDEVAAEHATDHVHLLFNNAGIGAGGSLFTDSRANWEKTFNVCWFGVYYMTRAFLPMLAKADEGHIANTSSVNGFHASLGPNTPHTAYSAAKFAVKGFTEALITDLRVNAPHVKCSVVMPGYIGTNIVANSRMVLAGRDTARLSDVEVRRARSRMRQQDVDDAALSDDDIRERIQRQAQNFTERAPTTAAQAATIILDAVKAGRWRVLVGEDAHRLDQRVRADPERAYDPDFSGLDTTAGISASAPRFN